MNRILMPVAVLLMLVAVACSGSKKAVSTENKVNASPYPKTLAASMAPGDSGFVEVEAQYIKGITAFELGDYDQALDLLLSVYTKVPGFGGVNYALSDCYLKMQDFDNAVFYAQEALKAEPDNKYYRLKMAEIYGVKGNLAGTVDQLEKARKAHPKDLDILFNLANAYSVQNKLLEANSVFGSILKVAGEDLQLRAKRFANFNELGMKDSALVELKRMQKAEPDNITTLEMLAQYQVDQKDRKGARSTLAKVLKLEPGNVRARVNLADIYIQENRWDSAGVTLSAVIRDSVIAAQNKLEILQFMYGRFREATGNAQLKKATRDLLETFLKTEPDFALGHAIAADFYITAGEQDAALNELRKTTELMPQNDNAWRTRIQVLYQAGQYEEAIDVGLEADGIFPDDTGIQFLVGSVYFIKNDHEKALEWFDKALKNPAKPEFKSAIWGSIGDVHAATRNWAKADSAYDKALALNPENENVLNNYAYYLSEREVELEKAEKMALQAIKIEPNNAAYLDTIGWVYFKMKNYKKALEYIQKAVNTGDASPTVLEHLGDCFEKLGKRNEARIWWKKALQQDPSRKHLEPKI